MEGTVGLGRFMKVDVPSRFHHAYNLIILLFNLDGFSYRVPVRQNLRAMASLTTTTGMFDGVSSALNSRPLIMCAPIVWKNFGATML